MSSRVPTIIDTLVAGFSAITAVLDGPKLTGDYSNSVIYVGWNGEKDSVGADVDEQWIGLGAGRKKEDVQIQCLLAFKDGSEDVKVCRDGAYALYHQVEAWLRANKSLGLPPPSLAQITSHKLVQLPAEQGMEARIAFTISVGERK